MSCFQIRWDHTNRHIIYVYATQPTGAARRACAPLAPPLKAKIRSWTSAIWSVVVASNSITLYPPLFEVTRMLSFSSYSRPPLFASHALLHLHRILYKALLFLTLPFLVILYTVSFFLTRILGWGVQVSRKKQFAPAFCKASPCRAERLACWLVGVCQSESGNGVVSVERIGDVKFWYISSREQKI